MISNKEKDLRFIAFLDENNKVVTGIFEIIEFHNNHLTFASNENQLDIPYYRILKVKKNLKGGHNK